MFAQGAGDAKLTPHGHVMNSGACFQAFCASRVPQIQSAPSFPRIEVSAFSHVDVQLNAPSQDSSCVGAYGAALSSKHGANGQKVTKCPRVTAVNCEACRVPNLNPPAAIPKASCVPYWVVLGGLLEDSEL